MTFTQLGLINPLLRALDAQGYTHPTPIQAQSIGAILDNQDILAAAQTGTGKTAAFTLPILQKISQSHDSSKKQKVRALVLTPTRELAAQVHESVKTYGTHLSIKSTLIFGGVGIHPQISALKKGVDIVVATPGRLLDLVSQKAIDLSAVEYLVLDEADRMLDMGFIHDIKKIVKLLPQKRQSLLFSATFSAPIKKLAHEFLNKPTTIEVAKSNSTASSISQRVHPVDKERKRELLSHIITSKKLKQVLIFTRTKHGANKLSAQLESDGITSSAIHGNKSQSARTKALADFKSGKVRALVATDIAARGIDIDALSFVVNFELPNVAEDYVHRIGRTGRAGSTGEAVSLVCVDEHHLQRDIERFIANKIPSETLQGFKPDPSIKAQPIQQRSNKPRRPQNRQRHR